MAFSPPAVAVRLFGPLRLVIGGTILTGRQFGGVKPRQLLSVLLLHRGRFIAKERLADEL